jgi:8-oxo-dGTP diphosphatase
VRLYVVGFLFSEDRKQVALIRKTHPDWQAGKLNGPGGKVEPNENQFQCMHREFLEETGGDVRNWSLFAWIDGTNGNYAGEPGSSSNEPFTVYFFRSFGDLSGLESKTEEKLEIIDVSDLTLERTVSNCQWLIPMALTMHLTPVQAYGVNERY